MTREIPLVKWMEKVEGEDKPADTAKMIGLLVRNVDPAKIPRGIDKFRLTHRIFNALDESIKTDKIVLSEGDYQEVRRIIENDVPAIWAKNEDVVKAVEGVLNARQLDNK